jgi:hypothetical protein
MCPYYIPKSTAFYLKNCGHKNKFKKVSKSKNWWTLVFRITVEAA